MTAFFRGSSIQRTIEQNHSISGDSASQEKALVKAPSVTNTTLAA
jgi:hypothetical protein